MLLQVMQVRGYDLTIPRWWEVQVPEVLLIFLVGIIAKSRLVSFDLLLRCTVLHCYIPQHPLIVNVNLPPVTHPMKEAYCNYASSSEL